MYRRLPHGSTQTLEQLQPKAVEGGYVLTKPIHVPPGDIGFGVKAYDRQQGTRNLNGVFIIESRVEGVVHWRSRYDTVAFEDSRYIQAHYDFAAKHDGDGYFYRMHRLPGDALSLYEAAPDDGYVALGFGESCAMETTVADPFGNTSILRYTVVADQPEVEPFAPSYNFLLRRGRDTSYAVADALLSISSLAMYTNTYLDVEVSDMPVEGAYTRCYTLGDAREPIHASAKLRVPLHDVPMHLRPNAYLSACDDATENIHFGSLSTGSTHLEVGMEEWSALTLRVDTLPPSIRKLDRYTYLLEDEVTPASALRYRVSQNNQWVLAGFDAKRNRLELRRDKLGEGPVAVEVWDVAGNRREL